jgi:hypothetical protein
VGVPSISEAPVKVLGSIILSMHLVEIAVFGSGFKPEKFQEQEWPESLDPALPCLALEIPCIQNLYK